jgi:hypothetical protein
MPVFARSTCGGAVPCSEKGRGFRCGTPLAPLSRMSPHSPPDALPSTHRDFTSSKLRRRSSARPHVVIVSDNGETLDGLQGYLQRAGMAARGTRQLSDALLDLESTTAVVVFPDDFAADEVMAVIASLARALPRVLRILVTRDPSRFQTLAPSNETQTPPVIIAKPAWGWTILDTIRGRFET